MTYNCILIAVPTWYKRDNITIIKKGVIVMFYIILYVGIIDNTLLVNEYWVSDFNYNNYGFK